MHAILVHFGPFRRPFRRHVPKTGYLVFGKKLLPNSGGAHFGGMSQKRGIMFSENKVGHFWGMRATALFIVAFVCIKLHPRIIVGGIGVVTLCFLPPGNRMRGGKRHLSAQREYHG